MSLEQATVPSHLAFTAGLSVSYARDVLEVERNGRVRPAVPSQIGVDLTLALGLFQFLELGVDVPFQIVEGHRITDLVSSSPGPTESFRGAADPRFVVKVPILRGGLRLAALLDLELPLGRASGWIGAPRYALQPAVLAGATAGPLQIAGGVALALRQEHRTCDHHATARPEVRCDLGAGFEIDDELALSAGARLPVGERFAVLAEGLLRIPVSAPIESVTLPVELRLGVDAVLTEGLVTYAGLGRGLSEGYGTPAFRGIVGVRKTFEAQACPTGPEDEDGYEDGDFCRDPDNDRDGILDEADVCPNDAEDEDGFSDRDGCPDRDNDADGIADAADRCPLEAEDRDGLQDDDGCPDPDNDQDRVVDYRDDCPMDPEDADQFEDEDGCPEPGPTAGTVTLTETRILISERIFFDYDRDTIRSVSLGILDSVAQVMRDTPRIRQVRIEGYTDSVGEVQYNLDLSYRRARAVLEYLVSKSVARNQLTYIGYGEQSPVADNTTPEGQALNRRVEFTIVSQESPAQAPTGRPGRGGRR
jgi:outer membrane protein OmpA-like peptidoglycan-associated protein